MDQMKTNKILAFLYDLEDNYLKHADQETLDRLEAIEKLLVQEGLDDYLDRQ